MLIDKFGGFDDRLCDFDWRPSDERKSGTKAEQPNISDGYMRAKSRLRIALFFTLVAVLGARSEASEECKYPGAAARIYEINKPMLRLIDRMRRTGDCSLIPNGIALYHYNWTLTEEYDVKTINNNCKTTPKLTNTELTEAFQEICDEKGKSEQLVAADDAMKSARAAAQYCTTADQEQAAQKFAEASGLYLEGGGAQSKIDEASRLQDEAEANAKGRCHRRATPSVDRKPRPTNTQSCAKGLRYVIQLQMQGEDAAAVKGALRRQGCPL